MSNCNCCKLCIYFEERTGFCRLNPPKSVQMIDRNGDEYITSVYPAIQKPELDWCSYFTVLVDENETDDEFICG